MDRHFVQNCSEVIKLFGMEIGYGRSEEFVSVELAMATKDVSDGKGKAKARAEEASVTEGTNVISNVDARTSRCKRSDGRRWRCKRTAKWPNSMCDICREKKRLANSKANKRNHAAAPVASAVLITPKASQKKKTTATATTTATQKKRKTSNWGIDDHLYYGGFAPSSYKSRAQSYSQAIINTNGQTTGAGEALMVAAGNNGMKWLKVGERSRRARRPANAHSLAQAIRAMIA